MEDPFEKGSRMYRTGDIAKWQRDGNIDFIGREDNQIKIRGYRIELGDIESSLLSYERIKEVAVTAIEEQGEKYLCAYITAKEEQEEGNIKNHLFQRLPEYMIPVRYMQLEKLPLTPNGKIDRKALPKPKGRIKTAEIFEAANSQIEAKLVSIWEKLLRVEKIGVNDSFFELGGHSLKATMLVGLIKKELDMEVPLKEIFRTPTIKGLAQYIEINRRQLGIEGAEDMLLIKKADSTSKNLFLIHDITCEVSGYREFCGDLNIDINCWGIRANIKNKYYPENISIEEIAAEYIEKIREVQKEGPYYLGGWSLGGIIVFEIARQLEQMEQEIEQLWIFDAKEPCAPAMSKYLHNKSQVEFAVATEREFVSSLLLEDTACESIKKTSTTEGIWDKTIRLIEKSDLNGERVRKFVEEYTENILIDIEDMEISQIIRYMNKIRSFERAVYMYKPHTVVKAPVKFIKAKESTWLKPEKWKKHVEGHLEIVEIPGNHYTIFKEPNVKEIVRVFESSFVKECW